MKKASFGNIFSLCVLTQFILLTVAITNAHAGENAKDGQLKLVAALPSAKLSLADGIRQATKRGETPLSAKFEFDDEGKLSLSIYVAGKGANAPAEQNQLQELSGDASADKWNPKTEVFQDVPHIARSAQQLTLVALGHINLIKMLERAQKEHNGKVYSITPILDKDTVKLVILMAKNGRSAEYTYNTGK